MTTPEPKPLDATLEDHGPRSMDQGNEHWRRLLLALEQWRMQSQHPTDFENDKLRVEMVGLQNTIAALTAELAERKRREGEVIKLAIETIEGLADQQAIDSPWYEEPLGRLRAALAPFSAEQGDG